MQKLVLLLTLLAAQVAAFAGPVDVHFASFNNTGQWQNGYPYYVYIQGMGLTPVMCAFFCSFSCFFCALACLLVVFLPSLLRVLL
jgi:hypothetical protein